MAQGCCLSQGIHFVEKPTILSVGLELGLPYGLDFTEEAENHFGLLHPKLLAFTRLEQQKIDSRKVGTFEARFTIEQNIAFGIRSVFKARDLMTGESVAIKREPVDAKDATLPREIQIYKELAKGAPGAAGTKSRVPRLVWFGSAENEEGSFNMMANELLGPSIREYRDHRFGGKLPLKETLSLAPEMIACLEFMHSKGFLHQSVHGRNFLLPRKQEEAEGGFVYVIDLEYASRFRTSVDQDAQKPLEHSRPNLMSIRAHQGEEANRRDDLESLGYLLLFLHLGTLPWKKLPMTQILHMKMYMPLSELCRGLPSAFADYLSYVRNLKFDETPDYEYLKNLFRKAA